MLYGLEPGLQKCFERREEYKMFQELKLVFHIHAHVEGRRPLTVLCLQRWRRIAQAVSMCSDCLGTAIA